MPKYSNKEYEYNKQYIKVALSIILLNDILALITSEEAIKSFNNDCIYIIYFTQDFVGIINKEDDYCMEESNNDGNYVILDNDKMVGKNSLTFTNNTEHGRVRYNFYNKFVQMIES